MSDYSVFMLIFNSYAHIHTCQQPWQRCLIVVRQIFCTFYCYIPNTIKHIYVCMLANWNALQKFQSLCFFVYVAVHVSWYVIIQWCCKWLTLTDYHTGVANFYITLLGSALAQRLANNIKTATSSSTHHITTKQSVRVIVG